MITMRLKNIVKKFPGTIALNNVDFILEAGTIHGLVGKNGAGKTTLINVMSGLIQPDSGDIYLFESKNAIRIDPHKAMQLGIAVIPQEPEDIPYMTITQNLFLDKLLVNKWGFVKIDELNQKARKICKNCKLDIDVTENVTKLSIAERQIISMIKAFYTQKNRIVILDEVTSALDKVGREEVHRVVREAVGTGISIVYISHELEEIFNICTDITVLRDGVNISKKKIKETNIKEITQLIVGSKLTNKHYKHRIDSKFFERDKEEVLSIEGLCGSDILNNVDLKLYKHEIVGLAGLRGSGRSELFKCVIGYNPIDKGLIKVNGNVVRFKSPNDALKYGICLLPEDREKEGLFSTRPVKENITISSLRKFLNRFKLINNKFEQYNVNIIINKLKIIIPSFNQKIEDLSGGNKQKVIVGRLLETKPLLYVLDEPTKGIDIETKQQILRFIVEDLSKEGSVLIASSEFEDLLQICNRIILLRKGEIVKEFNISEIDEEKLYKYLEAVEN